MQVEWLDLLALVLAPRALVDAWVHENGLFAEMRDWINVWGSTPATDDVQETPRRRWRDWIREQLAFLANCAFCLSYHAAFWLLLLLYAILLWLPPTGAAVGRFFLYWLALTQLSILLLERTHHE